MFVAFTSTMLGWCMDSHTLISCKNDFPVRSLDRMGILTATFWSSLIRYAEYTMANPPRPIGETCVYFSASSLGNAFIGGAGDSGVTGDSGDAGSPEAMVTGKAVMVAGVLVPAPGSWTSPRCGNMRVFPSGFSGK